jgi:hypothetical protein
MTYETLLRKLKINGDELMCCGGVSIFCSTSGARCVTIKRHEQHLI